MRTQDEINEAIQLLQASLSFPEASEVTELTGAIIEVLSWVMEEKTPDTEAFSELLRNIKIKDGFARYSNDQILKALEALDNENRTGNQESQGYPLGVV